MDEIVTQFWSLLEDTSWTHSVFFSPYMINAGLTPNNNINKSHNNNNNNNNNSNNNNTLDPLPASAEDFRQGLFHKTDARTLTT